MSEDKREQPELFMEAVQGIPETDLKIAAKTIGAINNGASIDDISEMDLEVTTNVLGQDYVQNAFLGRLPQEDNDSPKTERMGNLVIELRENNHS